MSSATLTKEEHNAICSPRPDSDEEMIDALADAIRAGIGEGDPFQVLLRDEYNRRRLNLHARAL